MWLQQEIVIENLSFLYVMCCSVLVFTVRDGDPTALLAISLRGLLVPLVGAQ